MHPRVCRSSRTALAFEQNPQGADQQTPDGLDSWAGTTGCCSALGVLSVQYLEAQVVMARLLNTPCHSAGKVVAGISVQL